MDAVEIARAHAAGYVWGRQDAGESGHDTGYSIAFGDAYAQAEKEYLAGDRGMMPCIERAFNEWRATGQITTGAAAPKSFGSYRITAQIESRNGPWTGSRQVTSFVLDGDDLGIVSEEHAARIAESILTEAVKAIGADLPTVHVTASKR